MLDWTKPIETTDGERCVLLGEKKRHLYWVAVETDDEWCTYVVEPNGICPGRLDPCIRNVPEKRRLQGWLNVYAPDDAHYYESRTEANISAHSNRIACVKMDQEYVVGEGLSLEKETEHDS